MWVWGKGIKGGDPDVSPQPLHDVFDGKGIAQVACSDTHTLFLSDTAEVWATGENMYGQVHHEIPLVD